MRKDPIARHYLDTALATFRRQKALAERAIAQLEDDELHRAPAEGSNSVAVRVRHLAGNMRSRFTDFLGSDGEKSWRRRDEEFVSESEPREALLARWQAGWSTVFDAVCGLADADLERIVRVRGEPLTALEAIQRQVGHYSYHVGQIVYVARQLAGERWESLSIPPGESDRYNESKGYRPTEGDA
ncbi:MAG: DinB family protein [Planctomycetota bacterium]|jgi:uncharacterized damage-inducible protein DinB